MLHLFCKFLFKKITVCHKIVEFLICVRGSVLYHNAIKASVFPVIYGPGSCTWYFLSIRPSMTITSPKWSSMSCSSTPTLGLGAFQFFLSVLQTIPISILLMSMLLKAQWELSQYSVYTSVFLFRRPCSILYLRTYKNLWIGLTGILYHLMPQRLRCFSVKRFSIIHPVSDP